MPQEKTKYSDRHGLLGLPLPGILWKQKYLLQLKMADFIQDFQSCTITMHILLTTALQMA